MNKSPVVFYRAYLLICINMKTNSPVINFLGGATAAAAMTLGGPGGKADAQDGVIPRARQGIRNTLGIQNPIFPELQRSQNSGHFAPANSPDLSQINPNPDSIGKTITDKGALNNIRGLYKILDPKKPTVISFTARLCKPCKHVKEATRGFMEDAEFATLREKYNVVQVNEENNGKLTLKYVDKEGKTVSHTITKKNESTFMGQLRPLFTQFTEVKGNGNNSTPTIGFISRGQNGEAKMTSWNIDARLNQTDETTPVSFGKALAKDFMRRMPAPKHVINPALLK